MLCHSCVIRPLVSTLCLCGFDALWLNAKRLCQGVLIGLLQLQPELRSTLQLKLQGGTHAMHTTWKNSTIRCLCTICPMWHKYTQVTSMLHHNHHTTFSHSSVGPVVPRSELLHHKWFQEDEWEAINPLKRHRTLSTSNWTWLGRCVIARPGLGQLAM